MTDDFLICAHCDVRYHRGVAHKKRCAEALATAADELRASLALIPHLTVHGVGVGDGTLYVYCRAKKNAQQRIPKEHAGFVVKYVLCSVMPASASCG